MTISNHQRFTRGEPVETGAGCAHAFDPADEDRVGKLVAKRYAHLECGADPGTKGESFG